MYMSRVRLDPGSARHPEYWLALGDEYKVHRLIWSLFSGEETARRDFLYRKEDDGELTTIYVVSQRQPEAHSRFWTIETKPFQPKFHAGQRLAFTLRANPVRARRDNTGKLHRHDVVMESKNKLKADHIPRSDWPPEAEIVQEAGYDWLFSRGAQHGFSVSKTQIRADSYRQHDFFRPRGNAHVRISSIDYSGILAVTEPDQFMNVFSAGIGPAKAFGCGLLLVKRP